MATLDEVAQDIVAEAQSRGHSRDECLAEMSALYQESGWNETIWDPTHTTYGVAQQDGSYPNRFDGYKAQIKAFFDKLDQKRTDPGHGDIWLNICWMQQAPNWPSAQYWYDNGRRAYLTEIQSRIDTVTPYLDKFWPAGESPVKPVEETPVADSKKPAYNEFPIWSPSNQDRGGQKPRLFLLHTQEGGGGNAAAEDLANFLANPSNEVSYHYAVSQASDGGVTVVDCVDTDFASWSVGDANNYSINLCFAGSSASWTRDQWMAQSNAIDVAACLAAQDIAKYPTIAKQFLGTGGSYTTNDANAAGVTDHRFVTDVIGWGTHVDVGPNFPADYFETRFKYWLAGGDPQAPPPVSTPPAAPTHDLTPTDPQAEILAQTRGRWEMLGNQTLVEAIAEIRDKIFGTEDRNKTGMTW